MSTTQRGAGTANMPRPVMPAALLAKLVRYENGVLYWRARTAETHTAPTTDAWNRRHAGHPMAVRVESVGRNKGRSTVTIAKRGYGVHRVIWALHYGEWPTHTIDHINGDPSDNRIENLRDIPLLDNIRAYFRKQNGGHPTGPHQVKVRTPWGRVYVGSFLTEAEANAAFRGAYAAIDAIEALSPLATPPSAATVVAHTAAAFSIARVT